MTFANIAPRTCAAGNFVDNIALVFFFPTECRSREFLLECFSWIISDLYVMTSEQRVSGSVKPLMYGRVANPRVCGGSTHICGGSSHLKNISTQPPFPRDTGNAMLKIVFVPLRRTQYHPSMTH